MTYNVEGKDEWAGRLCGASHQQRNTARAGRGPRADVRVERALRVWIDPAKLVSYGLSVSDVGRAIAAQNAQVSSGSIRRAAEPDSGRSPQPSWCKDSLPSVDAFSRIVLRQSDGFHRAHRRCCAHRGGPSGLSLQLPPERQGGRWCRRAARAGHNALETAKAVKARLQELSATFPKDIEVQRSLRHLKFVEVAINKEC